MKQFFTIYLLCLCLLVVQSCIPLINPEQNPTLGGLSLEDYVALGDRYVAGMTNGQREVGGLQGFYEDAQASAFPQLIAYQLDQLMKEERGDSLSFTQHLVPEGGSGFFVLDEIELRECDGSIFNERIRLETGIPDWIDIKPSEELLNNFGIPFLRLKHLFDPGSLTINPFFQRMLKPGDNPSAYTDFLSNREISLAVVWLGMEDVLSYAIRGAGNSAFPLISVSEFVANYSLLLDSLEGVRGEKFLGVIGNIPDVSRFPYFNSVPPTFNSSEDCDGRASAIFYESSEAGGIVRAATEDVGLVLSLREQLGTSMGGSPAFGLSIENPVPNYQVLDPREKLLLRQTIQEYNFALDSLVQAANEGANLPQWVVVDLFTAFEQLDGGIKQSGLLLNQEHLSGGIFSLDGLTLTPRGNAWVANRYMEAISQQSRLGARIPALDLPDYPGVVYP